MKRGSHAATDALAEDLRSAVGRFVRTVRNETGTATTAQSEVLAELVRGGPTSVTALAQLRGVKHQSMRLVVARLVEQGLLELLPNPEDGRSQLVAPTRAGRAQIKAQQAARADFLAGLLEERLTANERALLAQAVGLLVRLSG